MSTNNAPKPTRRRGTAAEEARMAIEQADADGVARDAMTLRMTLRDASELKRDPKVPMADISYGPDGMRYLGVAVDQGGGVTQSVLDRGDTGYVRGAAPEPPPAKPKAVRKKAVKKTAAETVE
jgi:hypothetical protein